MSLTDNEIKDALEYIRGVFPTDILYNRLVEEGAEGSEVHTIDGDDLAGACWNLNQLMEHFDVRDYRGRPDYIKSRV